MIVTEVKIQGNLEEDFAQFGAIAPKLADKAIRLVAYGYRTFIRRSYLSGQSLASQTGTLKKSISVGRKKVVGGGAYQKFVYWVGPKRTNYKRPVGQYSDTMIVSNIMENPNGYTIVPKHRTHSVKLNRSAMVFKDAAGNFVFTKKVQGISHPFIAPSVKAYPWTAKFEQMTESVIRSQLKKLAQDEKYAPGGLD